MSSAAFTLLELLVVLASSDSSSVSWRPRASGEIGSAKEKIAASNRYS